MPVHTSPPEPVETYVAETATHVTVSMKIERAWLRAHWREIELLTSVLSRWAETFAAFHDDPEQPGGVG